MPVLHLRLRDTYALLKPHIARRISGTNAIPTHLELVSGSLADIETLDNFYGDICVVDML